MTLPGFTDVEEAILAKAGDLDATRKRIRLVWASAALVAVALIAFGYVSQDWRLVTAAAVGYVFINTVERTVYGRAVLAYKGVIQKLLARSKEQIATKAPDR